MLNLRGKVDTSLISSSRFVLLLNYVSVCRPSISLTNSLSYVRLYFKALKNGASLQ